MVAPLPPPSSSPADHWPANHLPADHVPGVAGDNVAATRTLGDRYRLERQLAVGGMAEVWVATDLVLGRSVAVKMLKPALAADPIVRERFRREAVAVARISHPSIVRVFDTVTEDGVDAVVMELVRGPTLRQHLDRQGRLGTNDSVHIAVALADALDAAHKAGIIHRDVKPANVLLANEGRVLLTDFGIATATATNGALVAHDLTRDDVMMGTAKYLSPEQVLGSPVDGRSDLYSLGVVLYECLAGQAPFVADNDAATALARLQRPAASLSEVRPGIPDDLARVVHRLLARQPDQRPASAAELRELLRRLGPLDEIDQTVSVPTTPAGDSTAAIAIPIDGAGVAAGQRGPIEHTPTIGTVRPLPRHRASGHISQRRWLVALVVAALIATAVGLGAVLVRRTNAPAQDAGATTSTTSANGALAPETVPVPVSTVAPAEGGAPAIVGRAEFDPPPGDGSENSGMLGNLFDSDPSTVWKTLCYDYIDFKIKRGVGIIMRVSRSPANAHLDVTSASKGWSASVYVSDLNAADLANWGAPVASKSDIQPGTTRFDLGSNAKGLFVLLFVDHLAQSTTCVQHPYGVEIGDVRIRSK